VENFSKKTFILKNLYCKIMLMVLKNFEQQKKSSKKKFTEIFQ